MGPKDKADLPVQVPPHGFFFGGGLRMDFAYQHVRLSMIVPGPKFGEAWQKGQATLGPMKVRPRTVNKAYLNIRPPSHESKNAFPG